MKKTLLTLVGGLALVASAQQVTVTSNTRLLKGVEGPAYYPVLNSTGSQLLFASGESYGLKMYDFADNVVSRISDEMGAGIDASFSANGDVYYVTQKMGDNRLIYRTGMRYDNATAKEKAAAVVNPPGYSEHNCGLAADLNSPEHTGLDEGFEKTAAFRWLCEHAGDYGFILRYPKDAEDKTEIIYEPWHWRYVGVENAAKINASGLCFEDYIETLQSIAAKG